MIIDREAHAIATDTIYIYKLRNWTCVLLSIVRYVEKNRRSFVSFISTCLKVNANSARFPEYHFCRIVTNLSQNLFQKNLGIETVRNGYRPVTYGFEKKNTIHRDGSLGLNILY